MTREEGLLADLVGIPSPSGQEAAAATYLRDALLRFGWEEAGIDEAGSVVARRGSGERELLLLGHLDTVPGGPEVRLEGEVLWGRGSVDAKGPLCAFATAGGSVKLPGERAGLLMVYKVQDLVSYGLVMQAERAIRLQDRVTTP